MHQFKNPARKKTPHLQHSSLLSSSALDSLLKLSYVSESCLHCVREARECCGCMLCIPVTNSEARSYPTASAGKAGARRSGHNARKPGKCHYKLRFDE